MSPPVLTVNVQGGASVSADQFNTYEQVCPNLSYLRSFVPVENMGVFVQGFNTPGDGGAGPFWWNGSATSANFSDDNATIIVPFGVTLGVWLRLGYLAPGSTTIPAVANFAALSSFAWVGNQASVQTLGYYTPGDGGQAVYQKTTSNPVNMNFPSQVYAATLPVGTWAVLSDTSTFDFRQVGVVANSGATDDAPAVTAAIQWSSITGAVGSNPFGTTLASAVNVTLVGPEPVTIFGGSFYCTYTGATQFTFVPQSAYQRINLLYYDHIWAAAGCAAPLRVLYPFPNIPAPPAIPSQKSRFFFMEGVIFRSLVEGTSNYYATGGIYVLNAWYGFIKNCTFDGGINGNHAFVPQAFQIDGTSIGFTFTDVHTSNVGDGYSCIGWTQGVTFENCIAIGSDNGYVLNSNIGMAPPTSTGLENQPVAWFRGCHANVNSRGIKAINWASVIVDGQVSYTGANASGLNLACTSASASGSAVTFNFVQQGTFQFQAGQIFSATGFTPSTWNGAYAVQSATATSVTAASTITSGSPTGLGNVDAPYAIIVGGSYTATTTTVIYNTGAGSLSPYQYQIGEWIDLENATFAGSGPGNGTGLVTAWTNNNNGTATVTFSTTNTGSGAWTSGGDLTLQSHVHYDFTGCDYISIGKSQGFLSPGNSIVWFAHLANSSYGVVSGNQLGQVSTHVQLDGNCLRVLAQNNIPDGTYAPNESFELIDNTGNLNRLVHWRMGGWVSTALISTSQSVGSSPGAITFNAIPRYNDWNAFAATSPTQVTVPYGVYSAFFRYALKLPTGSGTITISIQKNGSEIYPVEIAGSGGSTTAVAGTTPRLVTVGGDVWTMVVTNSGGTVTLAAGGATFEFVPVSTGAQSEA